VTMQFGPEALASAFGKQMRQWAVTLGWATPFVSQPLPPLRVASLPLPPQRFNR
jgi:hypothetical protein